MVVVLSPYDIAGLTPYKGVCACVDVYDQGRSVQWRKSGEELNRVGKSYCDS